MGRLLILASLLAAGFALSGRAGEPPSAVARERTITAEDRLHWAFVPAARCQLPDVKEKAWPRNSIDTFVLASLEAAGLSPSPEADRYTLLRRLSFDLTGLAPTPEETDAFVNDRADNAYEKQAQRLLDSPQYGVRWARHWLDLVCYADSDGFENDRIRPNAWRYRDWLVYAMNRDMPYDEFVRRQVAGDEVERGDPLAFIATGFNRCYPDMVDQQDQVVRRQDALNDITETTGLVFLGLTIGCARCHDHKYDSIRQSDFYKLQAFFAAIRFQDDYPIASARQRAQYQQQMQAWELRSAPLRSAVLQLEAPCRAGITARAAQNASAEVIGAFRKPESERTAHEVALLYNALRGDQPLSEMVLREKLDPKAFAIRSDLLGRLQLLRGLRPLPLPRARGIDEAGPAAPPTYVLNRGEYKARRAKVDPDIPAVLRPEYDPPLAIVAMGNSSGRRRALARWLTRHDNPLTARVIVNRLWQHHFGRGIVATASDFGVMGDRPTRPELLDWLACELISQRWSMKALHRLMVTSSTYRQAPIRVPCAQKVDPENLLLWRQNRRRLDAEEIRDSLLGVAGLLSLKRGGPGISPETPDTSDRPSRSQVAQASLSRSRDPYRRSLYVSIRRNKRYPFFEVFDRPDSSASCPQRTSTTGSLQALSLLNSQFACDMALAMALRVTREAGTDGSKFVDRAFRLALGRRPEDQECRWALQFLKTCELADLCLALINANEFVYVD